MEDIIRDYREVFRIRNFENTILDLFDQDKLTGTTHTCIGQEATPVALVSNLTEKDYIFGNHRSHGYIISYAKTTKPLMSEIMGKKAGMCRGRGGSQHICYKNYRSNGVQGGIVPNATGMAMAEKYKQSGAIVVALMGDGTIGQGVVYESMNMASLFQLPILYLIEDNAYAMTTPSSYAIQGNLKTRIEGFGMRVDEITSNDTRELRPFFEEATSYVRQKGLPICCIVHTYRLGPHSKSDDTRNPEEINEHKKNDPIKILEAQLPDDVIARIQSEEIAALQEVVKTCETEDIESLKDLQLVNFVEKSSSTMLNTANTQKGAVELNAALDECLSRDKTCVILGEDIRDPYGGAFKATKNLSEKYDERVLNTPISEAAMVGIGVGMAMQGMHPIVEMMFGDFISLGFDQLLNHAAKYHWMYAEQINVPLLVRTPMGGKRGYGATHSQSLEKYLIGIPGIDVIALSPLHNLTQLYRNIYSNLAFPTVLIEDKTLYGQRMWKVDEDNMYKNFYVRQEQTRYPMITMSMDEEEEPEVVILTYGGMTISAAEAADKLMMQDEILSKIVVMTRLNHIDYDSLCAQIGDAKCIVTVEPGTKESGWGAEIISTLAECLPNKKYKRIATLDLPVPCNKSLENEIIPNSDNIYQTINNLVL